MLFDLMSIQPSEEFFQVMKDIFLVGAETGRLTGPITVLPRDMEKYFLRCGLGRERFFLHLSHTIPSYKPH